MIVSGRRSGGRGRHVTIHVVVGGVAVAVVEATTV